MAGKLGRGLIWGGGVIAVITIGMYAEQHLIEDGGPKNGITQIHVDGCGAADTIKPFNIGNAKLTRTQFKAAGIVSVSLVTEFVPESQIRDPGHFEDPSVPVTTLVVECDQEPTFREAAQISSIVKSVTNNS